MRTLFAASALALAIASAPTIVSAQSTTPATPDSTAPTATQDTTAPTTATGTFSPTPDQQSQIDAWAAEQKTRYNAWPSTYQEYFWTLEPDQQKGWWALTDEQKAQIYAMTPEQRTQVWPSIVAQISGRAVPSSGATPAQPNPGMGEPATPATPAQPATPPSRGMSSMDSSTTGNMTPPPASAMNEKYPVCSKTVTDSCRNRGGV